MAKKELKKKMFIEFINKSGTLTLNEFLLKYKSSSGIRIELKNTNCTKANIFKQILLEKDGKYNGHDNIGDAFWPKVAIAYIASNQGAGFSNKKTKEELKNFIWPTTCQSIIERNAEANKEPSSYGKLLDLIEKIDVENLTKDKKQALSAELSIVDKWNNKNSFLPSLLKHIDSISSPKKEILIKSVAEMCVITHKDGDSLARINKISEQYNEFRLIIDKKIIKPEKEKPLKVICNYLLQPTLTVDDILKLNKDSFLKKVNLYNNTHSTNYLKEISWDNSGRLGSVLEYIDDNQLGEDLKSKVAAICVISSNKTSTTINEVESITFQQVINENMRIPYIFSTSEKSGNSAAIYKSMLKDDQKIASKFTNTFIHNMNSRVSEMEQNHATDWNKRRMDSLARLLSYNTSCASVSFDGVDLNISFNEIYKTEQLKYTQGEHKGKSVPRIEQVKKVLSYLQGYSQSKDQEKFIEDNSDKEKDIIFSSAQYYDQPMGSSFVKDHLEYHSNKGSYKPTIQELHEKAYNIAVEKGLNPSKELMEGENEKQQYTKEANKHYIEYIPDDVRAVVRLKRDLTKLRNALNDNDNFNKRFDNENLKTAFKQGFKESQILLTGEANDKCHAEMRQVQYYKDLLNEYNINKKNSDWMAGEGSKIVEKLEYLKNNGAYIGLSKLCCGHCSLALNKDGQGLDVLTLKVAVGVDETQIDIGTIGGSHGLSFEWYIVEAIKNNENMLKNFLGTDAYNIYQENELNLPNGFEDSYLKLFERLIKDEDYDNFIKHEEKIREKNIKAHYESFSEVDEKIQQNLDVNDRKKIAEDKSGPRMQKKIEKLIKNLLNNDEIKKYTESIANIDKIYKGFLEKEYNFTALTTKNKRSLIVQNKDALNVIKNKIFFKSVMQDNPTELRSALAHERRQNKSEEYKRSLQSGYESLSEGEVEEENLKFWMFEQEPESLSQIQKIYKAASEQDKSMICSWMTEESKKRERSVSLTKDLPNQKHQKKELTPIKASEQASNLGKSLQNSNHLAQNSNPSASTPSIASTIKNTNKKGIS
ncbi:MAG: hypothetical protein DGJ47_001143 [Rickettsiaceae bacterium]